MLKPENQVDKDRFETLKDAAEERGQNEKRANNTAAAEVKELRRSEGRSKDSGDVTPLKGKEAAAQLAENFVAEHAEYVETVNRERLQHYLEEVFAEVKRGEHLAKTNEELEPVTKLRFAS